MAPLLGVIGWSHLATRLELALLIHALRHCVQCEEASFEVRYFDCKAENLRKPHRTFSQEECNRSRQISKAVHQSHSFFQGKITMASNAQIVKH